MRERALIHVAGPSGAGKTTFIEAMLAAVAGSILAARCVRDEALRASRETVSKAHLELRRYRKAGAIGAALFAFPSCDVGSDAFFVTRLMEDYSEAVVLEGDNPLGFVDLGVFVAPALATGKTVFVRRKRDAAGEERARADAMERQLRGPNGVGELLGPIMGGTIGELVQRSPKLIERTRTNLLAGIAAARKAPAPKPTESWAVAPEYSGIAQAQLVVVNIRSDDERERAEKLVSDVVRLRKDETLFNDILGFRGTRIPVTAIVANLTDQGDSGRKKVLARVRRTMGTRSP